jgi:hypothetical protein
MKPRLHAILSLYHGLLSVATEILALVLPGRILFIYDLHMLEFEVIDALACLQQLLVLADVVLHTLLSEVDLRLPADVQVEKDAPRILSLQTETIYDVCPPLLIKVTRADELVQL